MKTVDLIEYLTETELNLLKGLLDKDNIVYIVKQHGGASKRESYYFKISVSVDDIEKAWPAAQKIRQRQKRIKIRCPKCDSGQYKKIENLNWFMRLWYSGTTPVRCKKCRTEYFI